MTVDPTAPLRGGIDLSALAARGATTAAGTAAASSGAVIVEMTEANFEEIAERSSQVPVIVNLHAAVSQPSIDLTALIEKMAGEYAGRFVLANCDVQAHPAVAQAFQAQAVPAVVALIAGRPAPLFQGTATREQLVEVIDQVLAIAVESGIVGTATGDETKAEDAAPPPPPPLPPLHQEAFDAIERNDLDAAAAAYRSAITQNPRDSDARAGLAQVGLMQRTAGADLQAARKAAADAPEDPGVQMAVADLDVLGGKVEDAFVRLVDLIRTLPADAREPVRLRLVDLFEIVGAADPRVVDARRALAAVLF